MINVSDRLTAKTVENILTDAREIAWQKGDVNLSTSGTVATALNEIDDKIGLVALGVKVSISRNPDVMYKNTNGITSGATITATMTNSGNNPRSMSIYSGTSTTAIATGTGTTVTANINFVPTASTYTFRVEGEVKGMSLPSSSTSISARYPIYYGFKTTQDVPSDINEILGRTRISATTTVKRNYNKYPTNSAKGYYFIILPPDITESYNVSWAGSSTWAYTKSNPFTLQTEFGTISGYTALISDQPYTVIENEVTVTLN